MSLSPDLIAAVESTAYNRSIAAQAATLNVSQRTIKHIRSRLLRAGKLASQRQPWTSNEDEELIDGLRWGLSLHRVARRLNRTVSSVRRRSERLGGILAIRCGEEAIDTISAVRSVSQVAVLLGMPRQVVTRLCEMGIIKYNRAGYTQPKGRKKNWQYFISDDSLLLFLDDYHFSFLVDLDRIEDADWREYARLAREGKDGYWMLASDIAHQIGYTRSEGARWCASGRIAGLLFMSRWYIWSEDAAPLLESKTAPKV